MEHGCNGEKPVMNASFNPAHNNSGKHLRSGVLNTGVIQVIKVLCSFASVVLLSRLLPPSDFGVVAMVTPIIYFVSLFQSLGLNQATIQKTSISHDEINAFFWINILVGLILSLLVFAISPLVGWYYGDERVVPLTIAMGALIFLGSSGGQHGALLSRRMEFTKSAVIDGMSTVGSLAVAVLCAWVFHDYWALYYATLAGTVISLVGSWAASNWRPSWPRKVSGIKGMLRFGAGITSFNFMNFFARNFDNVLIGHAWGGHELGLYDRAYKVLLFPLQRVVWPLGGVMVPLLSRLKEEPERYRQTFLKVQAQLALAAWPGIVWGLVFADTLIPNILGAQWEGAAAIFKPLALASFAQVAMSGVGWLFVSQGRAKDYVRWGAVNTVLCILGFVVGLPYGAFGVAVGYAASEFLRVPYAWWAAGRRGPVNMRDIVVALSPQFVGSVVAGIVLWGAMPFVGDLSRWVVLPVSGLLAYIISLLIVCLFPAGRETIRLSWRFLLQSLIRKKVS